MKEQWKPISGFEHYEISNLGRIRSLHKNRVRIRKTHQSRDGYILVSLYKKGNPHNFARAVHPLVAAAFVGTRLAGMQVNHKDGVKTNNRANNLEYCTQSENQRHAIDMGLWKPNKGIAHGMAKLTEQDVRHIRGACKAYGDRTILAGKYGLTVSGICRIVNRKVWKHIA